MASAFVQGTFTATGESGWVPLRGPFGFTLQGGVGTVQLERSYDGGVTAYTISKNTDGDAASYTLTAGQEVGLEGFEPEDAVLYRVACTAYTSGTITYRLSQ